MHDFLGPLGHPRRMRLTQQRSPALPALHVGGEASSQPSSQPLQHVLHSPEGISSLFTADLQQFSAPPASPVISGFHAPGQVLCSGPARPAQRIHLPQALGLRTQDLGRKEEQAFRKCSLTRHLLLLSVGFWLFIYVKQ